ncbi:MAG TPA: glycosyltransferase family 39 protein [Pyrinomonadaceae bacterium]|nr:glycosyltransferase family 39 protein [Pyrinomonadaceae bacterium]
MTKLTLTEHRAFWAAIAVITIFVYLFGLGVPLLGPDEPRYAQVAREMFDRGDWITPTLGGFNWFEKPSLLYWLQIVFYNLFGVSEYSARLGSALFGLGTVASLWFLGRQAEIEIRSSQIGTEPRFFGKNLPDFLVDRLSGWFALIAASSLGLFAFARGASFDIILTFPIAASLVCFYIFDSRSRIAETSDSRDLPAERRDIPRHGRGSLYLLIPLAGFYFFMGLALLAKGLIGAVFPLGIVGTYFLLSRRLPSRRFLLSLLWGGVFASGVASVWYLPMYLRHGWEFIDQFFVQHHFQRYTSNKYRHPQPFHFFYWVLPLMTIPWLPFFAVGVWKAAIAGFKRISGRTRGNPETRQETNPFDRILLFAACWMAFPLAFFTFSGSKLPGYILPALPGAVTFTALFVVRTIGKNKPRQKWLKLLGVATFVVYFCILVFALPRYSDTDTVKGLMASAAEQGHLNEKVIMFRSISHSAEFYAAGRLVRVEDGNQRLFMEPEEVRQQIEQLGEDGLLVLLPLRFIDELRNSPLLSVELIRDNGYIAIVHVRRA